MGRKVKYSKDIKLRAVKEYNDGIKSYGQLGNELGCHLTTVESWVKTYNAMGHKAFDEKPRNKSYSKKLKLAAIKDYLDGKGSLEDISNIYGIYSTTTLNNWIIKYNSHKEIKDYDPKGDVYMTKARKTTLEERLEIVKYCLGNDKSYKLSAEKFEQPYHLIYQWVQKYLEQGEQGLIDNRGRNKAEEELSEADKLKRENERLKAQNLRLHMENELLKKLEEIERRESLIRYGKKQNTKR